MKLKDTLKLKHDHAWFTAFAKEAGMDVDTDPDQVAEELAKSLLDPDVMQKRMMTLHDDDIDFMRYVIRQGKPVMPTKASFISADRLRTLDYGAVVDQAMHFDVPEDVAEAFAQIDTAEFHARRQKMAWLYDCVTLIPYFYAILSIHDLGTLYRRRKGFDESNEEIVLGMLRELARREDMPCYLQGNELIVNGLVETGQEAKLRTLHESMPIGLPSYSEIKDIIENRYPSREKSYQTLKKFLIRELKVRDDFVDALLEAIWQYIATGNTFADTMQMIRNERISVTEVQEAALKVLMADAWDHTRMLMCNGHRPCETMPNSTYVFTQD